jgi:hypothetical protein
MITPLYVNKADIAVMVAVETMIDEIVFEEKPEILDFEHVIEQISSNFNTCIYVREVFPVVFAKWVKKIVDSVGDEEAEESEYESPYSDVEYVRNAMKKYYE